MRRLPNLKQLRAFDAAARLSSFRGAADELGVTQAAISHQIKALEAYFGRQLFDRLNRKIALRNDARELAEDVGAALRQIEEAAARYQQNEMTGTIRISVTPFYANRMVLPFLDEFAEIYPEISVEFDYSYQIADFGEGTIHAALRYGLSEWAGERRELIHHDRVVPVTSPKLIAGEELPFSAAKIASFPLAAVEGQERYWGQWFAAASFEMPGACDISRHAQRALALDYAVAGNAIALADLPLIRNELATGSLVQLSPTATTLDRGIHLATPDSPFLDKRLTAFADWLRRRVALLSGGEVAT